jgi:hypothetical protein
VTLSTHWTLTSVSGDGASDASDDRARKRALWTASDVASDAGSSSVKRVCRVVLKRCIILVTVGDQLFSFNRGHVALIRCELLRGIGRWLRLLIATALFCGRAYKWPFGRLWLAAEHTLALVTYVVVLRSPLTHSCLIVFIGSSERAILVRLHCEIASSDTR